jgi:GntR family transcriptional regulator
MSKVPDHKLVIPPVSAASPKPYYAQIIDGIRREVGSGRLEAHAPLPSFRELAEDLLVSLITVKRAYEELERAGIIYRKQGLGTFVAEQGAARSREAKTEQIEEHLRRAVREGREAGLQDGQIMETLQRLLRKH